MRKYDLKAIRAVSKGVQEQKARASDVHELLKINLENLDSAESKKKYSASWIAAEKGRLRQEAATQLKEMLTTAKQNSAGVLSEKGRWAKSALLAEARFISRPQQRADAAGSERALIEMLADLRDILTRSHLSSQLSRMDDDTLLDLGKSAAEANDAATLGAIVGEAGLRKSAFIQASLAPLVRSLELPEATEAAALFSELERGIHEIEAYESVVASPSDSIGKGVVDYFSWARRNAAAAKEKEKEEAAPVADRLPDGYRPPEGPGFVAESDLPPAA